MNTKKGNPSAGRLIAARVGALLAGAFVVTSLGCGTTASEAVGSNVLTVTNGTTWAPSAPQGGAIGGITHDVGLRNNTGNPVDWTAQASVPWIASASSGGTLAPSQTENVQLSLVPASFSSLQPGMHSGNVTFQQVGGGASAVLSVDLQVLPTTAQLVVTPPEDLAASGPQGGPMAGLSKTYTLAAGSGSAVDWYATADVPWVLFTGASSGQLAGGTQTQLPLTIDAGQANAMAPGNYAGTVEIREAGTSTIFATRQVTLDVSPPQVAAGFTQFTPSSDTRTIYVSSSTGNDGYDGLSQATPKKSLAAGIALLRDGYPDWLLLKCGDVWVGEHLGSPWTRSGRSPTEPMLVSSYGTGPRPLIHPQMNSFLMTSPGGGSPSSLANVAIVGLHARPYPTIGSTDGAVGCYLLLETVNWLIEDCVLEGFKTNLAVQSFSGVHRNIQLRRNVVRYAFSKSSHSSGMYCDGVDGVLIEENLMDHNGWAEGVSGAEATIFNHNLYMTGSNKGNIVVRGNIAARASSHGLYLRAGGLLEENLFLKNPIAAEFGGGNPLKAGGATGTVRRNVVLDSFHIDGWNRGWGLKFSNIHGVPTCLVEDNIVAHNVNGHLDAYAIGMFVDGGDNVAGNVGVHNILFRNNLLYGWGGEWVVSGTPGGGFQNVSNLQFDSNIIQNDVDADPYFTFYDASSVGAISQSTQGRFFGLAPSGSSFQIGPSSVDLPTWQAAVGDVGSLVQAQSYVDPNRTIETYAQSQGLAPTLDAFLDEAALQSRTNWRPEFTAAAVNDYVRQGFQ